MTAIERTAYPQFKHTLTNQELDEFYTLSETEIIWVKQNAGNKSQQLPLASALKGFQKLGYLPFLANIPKQITGHLAKQLSLSPRRRIQNLTRSTRKRYKHLIRTHLQIKPYGTDGKQAIAQVVQQTVLSMSDPASLINVAIEELVRQQFELPGYTTLDEFVNHIRHQSHLQLYKQVMAKLTKPQTEALDNLLKKDDDVTRYPFNQLKSLPQSASLKVIRHWEKHLTWLELIVDPEPLLIDLTNTKIKQFATEAYQLETGDILDVTTDARRYTLLLCLIHQMQIRTRDQLTTMYLKRISLLHRNGKKRLRNLQDEHRSLTEMMVDTFAEIVNQTESTPIVLNKKGKQNTTLIKKQNAKLGQEVRQLLQAQGGISYLKTTCLLLQAYHHNNYLPLLGTYYKKNRAMPFRLTEQLQIKSATKSQNIVQALAFIHQHRHSKEKYLPADISLSFATPRWRALIQEKMDGETKFNKQYLEACVFSALADGINNGDLYVQGTETYADYRTQLLPWSACEKILPTYCQTVSLPKTAANFVTSLRQTLRDKIKQVDEAHAQQTDLYFDEEGKPHLKKLTSSPPPEQVKTLATLMRTRLPERHLLDILLNVHHWLPYSRHFGPPSGSDPKLKDAIGQYLLTTFSYGCDLGPAQTARHVRHITSARVLGRINAQHITTEKLDAAIRDVVNEYARFPLPRIWGASNVSVADGTHYALHENNLMGERHIRYGDYGGIAYHHISDTYVALFSHFIACGVWEAVYILDGLLQNKSVFQPDTVHADTQGQSEAVFGLSHLLGIKLMPRMRNWNKVTMYRPDETLTCTHIGDWFTRTINWELIEAHWQALMQVILSIHKGKILPSWLLQKLNSRNPKNKLYLAFRELGRVIRTLFLLEYASNPTLRRQIQAATSKIEAYNRFSQWIYFGGDGILGSRDPVEYEKRIKYKDLIANAIMLQNVADMTNVLHDLAKEGHEITPEIVANFSPYIREHIKRFGEYVIDIDRIPPPLQPDKPFLSQQMT